MKIEGIRIVLVGTTHPGNIGGAARAMKNMGFSRLSLVAPKIFPSDDASARAAGADDILSNAQICSSLEDAVAECSWVVGTSARQRKVAVPTLSPRDAARGANFEVTRGQVAFVFGREHSGLTNDEIDLCHALVHIPTNPEFSSLNLAAAVQILCYELRLVTSTTIEAPVDEIENTLATTEEMNEFFTRIESVLREIGYLKPPNCEQLLRRIKRIYSRARPDRRELNILHGILSATIGNKYRWMDKLGQNKPSPGED